MSDESDPNETSWWDADATQRAETRPLTTHGTRPLAANPTRPLSGAAERADAGAEAEQVTDGPTEPATTPVSPDSAAESDAGEPPDADEPVASDVPTIRAAALRDRGMVRAVNQDHVFSLLTTLPREEHDLPLGLFVVADGMGGHAGGEIASQIAIAAVAETVLVQLLIPALGGDVAIALRTLMDDALLAANGRIWAQAQRDGSDMGTTCTAALLLGRTLYLGHVGDSRAYVLRRGALLPLTDDHSTVGRLIALGEVTRELAREHPQRSQLYRSVGQTATIAVDVVVEPLDGAEALLVASDGLWSMLEETELHAILRAAATPEAACSALIDAANAAGGDDNISAVVVMFG